MVDQAKLDQMLTNLRAFAQVLRGLGNVPRDAFLNNPDKVGNAKYHFVIAIECCIDIQTTSSRPRTIAFRRTMPTVS